MALREKFGKLVLLEETGASALGLEYRAARLGPAGLDRLVTVLRFGPEVSSNAEATKRLMDEARLAARLQSPGLVRVLGIGRVEQSVYVSTELVEGRSVEAMLERCRGEAFPFAADHALMIASRAAVAFEFLHGKRNDAGVSLFHGLVAPSRLAVAFDGEVKVKGLGLWPALRGTDLLPAEERRYLAPEQVRGEAGDPRSDVYALGLVLLEALTGQAPDGNGPARRPRGRAHHGHDRRRGPAAEAARGTAAPRPWPRARASASPAWSTFARRSTRCSSRGTSRPRRSTSPSSCTRCSARTWRGRRARSRMRAAGTTASSSPGRSRRPRRPPRPSPIPARPSVPRRRPRREAVAPRRRPPRSRPRRRPRARGPPRPTGRLPPRGPVRTPRARARPRLGPRARPRHARRRRG